jgi:predicted metal-dependent hydrolase
MLKSNQYYSIEGIEFRVVYSRRRTIGISVLPDSSVIVRVPYLTSGRTIERIVREKMAWIIKHRDNYRKNPGIKKSRRYADGEMHLYRGNEYLLRLEIAKKLYVRLSDNTIEAGVITGADEAFVKRLLYAWYKNEANNVLPTMFNQVLENLKDLHFKPSGLVIRTMKRRWGSCSSKRIVTLSTELIKLPDRYIEYVIIHELCHLRHHNHGSGYYRLLSELCPDYAILRKELRHYIM